MQPLVLILEAFLLFVVSEQGPLLLHEPTNFKSLLTYLHEQSSDGLLQGWSPNNDSVFVSVLYSGAGGELSKRQSRKNALQGLGSGQIDDLRELFASLTCKEDGILFRRPFSPLPLHRRGLDSLW